MRRPSRCAAHLLLLAAILTVLATPALAQQDQTTDTGQATTTVQQGSGLEPAVSITVPAESAPTPDWTYRYMIPTTIVLAVLIVVVTTVQYFTRVVRKRYRIVRE